MALPSIEKNWQFNLNNQIVQQSTTKLTNASLLVEMKNAMIGFGSNPWTVVGSSDASTAGLDAVDRWVTNANLSWNNNGSAHSWIVLKQTGLDTNFQLLISCNQGNANGDVLYMSYSPSSGYTGGSTTARPTATDETILKNNAAWGGVPSPYSYRFNVQQSNDGQCTRIWIFNNNSTYSVSFSGFWIFDAVKLPTASWTNPYFAGVIGTSLATSDIGFISNFGTTSFLGRHSGTQMSIAMTWEGSAWNGVNSYPITTLSPTYNEISGEYEMYPIGIASATPGSRGRHGQVYDLWWTGVALPDGAFYPDNSSKLFVKLGPFIIPWSGNTQMIRG